MHVESIWNHVNATAAAGGRRHTSVQQLLVVTGTHDNTVGHSEQAALNPPHLPGTNVLAGRQFPAELVFRESDGAANDDRFDVVEIDDHTLGCERALFQQP